MSIHSYFSNIISIKAQTEFMWKGRCRVCNKGLKEDEPRIEVRWIGNKLNVSSVHLKCFTPEMVEESKKLMAKRLAEVENMKLKVLYD